SGYPGCVIPNVGSSEAPLLDDVPMLGNSPEVGYKSILSGALTGTSVVTGPALDPPYLFAGSLNRTTLHQNGGSATPTVGWSSQPGTGHAPSTVHITPSSTDPGTTFTPSSQVAPSTDGGTVAFAVHTTGSSTTGSKTITLANDGSLLPITLGYTIGNV